MYVSTMYIVNMNLTANSNWKKEHYQLQQQQLPKRKKCNKNKREMKRNETKNVGCDFESLWFFTN